MTAITGSTTSASSLAPVYTAEASDQPIDLDFVKERVQLFQTYLTKHMPTHPSDDLKNLVQDVFLDIQRLSDHLAEEAKLSKSRIAEMANSQKITHTYTYGVRK